MMAIVRFSSIFATACLLWSCACSDEVRTKLLAPDSAMAATAYVRNCGATTDYSSIVSVHRESDSFRDEAQRVLVVQGRHEFQLNWRDARTLVVRCVDCEREDIFREVDMLNGVAIVYELRQRP